ncbi:MAG: hypothetical protein HY437_00980 [Candidatus Magasanikbacteria bacterium]|nr:hypothetical protein [Candidatus Magasanikbacteria bacterium]
MSTLGELPGWALKLHANGRRFSEAGLNGLVDHAEVTNRLGEALARGNRTPAELEAFLNRSGIVGVDAAAVAVPPAVTFATIWENPQGFWGDMLPEIFGAKVMTDRRITIPPLVMKQKTVGATTSGNLGEWFPIYLPKGLTAADYPADFVKPAWDTYLTVSDIQRRPLPGRWVVLETIRKPDYDDSQGYGNGNDPLAVALGLKKRFGISWDDLHKSHLPKVAKLLGLSKKAVRLTTAEEWNLIGNLFLWLNRHRNMNLPDLGSTNSWEWCENSCGDGSRLVVGRRGSGGLAVVGIHWHDVAHDNVGFRVLAVL